MPDRSWLIYLKGIGMGITDVIPGVSGGTMALILGLYRRLIHGLNSLDSRLLGRFVRWLIKPTGYRWARLVIRFRRAELPFLIVLGLGILTAVVGGVWWLPPLIEAYPTAVRAGFLGLILISAWVPLRTAVDQGGFSGTVVIPLVVGLVIGILFSLLTVGEPPSHRWYRVDPDGRSLEEVVEQYPTALPGEELIDHPRNDEVSQPLRDEEAVWLPYVPAWMVPIMGAVAVSALVLPGISGAYLLLIMGGYTYLLQTGKGLLQLGLAGEGFGYLAGVVVLYLLGALVGLKLICGVLDWCLRVQPGPTYGALTGLMLGALPAVWPYRSPAGLAWPGLDSVVMEVGPVFTGAVLVTLGVVTLWERKTRST